MLIRRQAPAKGHRPMAGLVDRGSVILDPLVLARRVICARDIRTAALGMGTRGNRVAPKQVDAPQQSPFRQTENHG